MNNIVHLDQCMTQREYCLKHITVMIFLHFIYINYTDCHFRWCAGHNFLRSRSDMWFRNWFWCTLVHQFEYILYWSNMLNFIFSLQRSQGTWKQKSCRWWENRPIRKSTQRSKIYCWRCRPQIWWGDVHDWIAAWSFIFASIDGFQRAGWTALWLCWLKGSKYTCSGSSSVKMFLLPQSSEVYCKRKKFAPTWADSFLSELAFFRNGFAYRKALKSGA